jgi:23S rRNA (cytosine1962-C5)-methyltransferase
MFGEDQYALLDFGRGRKLERFGPLVLDRPAPAAAAAAIACAGEWEQAAARYDRGAAGGGWRKQRVPPPPWRLRQGVRVFELKLSPAGAVGVFPEQGDNWDWIERQVRQRAGRLKVLNLFAYTGGSTLAAAGGGAAVVHVDAARPVVSWARHNAALSGLQDAAVRWIVEDARKFVDRELRRGHAYQAVILDPPTYGHGPQSQPWHIDDHLPDLVGGCVRLTRRDRAFILLTCHAPGWGPEALRKILEEALGGTAGGVAALPLTLRSRDGRLLSSGSMARWPHR